MLTASTRFRASEQADVNQVATKVLLVLGNYAAATGASATASGSDGSGNYPASGAIDGDRTELNVGAATAADNDVGKSSWRSAVAPSVTPQTLKIDMGVSRTISRIKLYHLASHGLSSYKLESSPDDATYTLIAKTTDQGGTITSTHQLDTVDFTDVACRYVKLTIADTVVAADKANVVEMEIYRLVDISDRVTHDEVSRQRDYKLLNPIASTFSLMCSNEDKFFSPSYSPTTTEIAAGFVNSELSPNNGIIIEYGYAFGGGTPEFVTVFNGLVDRYRPNAKEQTAVIEGRDPMKVIINQITSSKLKAAQDISACMIYALNLANISTWETSIDTTGLIVDYFFINNQSILTVIRDLVQASADAAFWYDESGIATFKYYVNSTPQIHTDSTEAQFEAGTLTNIDTTSIPDQIGRKWFLVDDFADGNFNSNPAWSNRVTPLSVGDDSQADFTLGSVKTNIDLAQFPGSIQRDWYKFDDFADGDYTGSPHWTVDTLFGPGTSGFPPPANGWSVVGSRLKFTDNGFYYEGRANATTVVGISPNVVPPNNSGHFRFSVKFTNPGSMASTTIMFAFNPNYFVRFTPNGASSLGQLFKQGSGGGSDVGVGGQFAVPNDGAEHTIDVSFTSTGFFNVGMDGVFKTSGTSTAPAFIGSWFLTAIGSFKSTANAFAVLFGNMYYSRNGDSSILEVPTTSQAVFESRTFDQTAAVLAEGLFSADYTVAPGCSISFFTATSADGVSWDSYVAATPGSLVLSTARRYIKYKVLFVTPADAGTLANYNTPKVNSVSIQYTTVGWQCVSNAIKYLPGTTGLRAGIDIVFTAITGTWRANITMTPGTGAGMATRMYILSTGYDTPSSTYLSGYYAQIDQANGKLGIYKINASASRTLLAEFAIAINTSVHSLRLTRSSAGQLTLFWDEVQKAQVTDTGFASNAALAFEVDPLADTNGNVIIDDITYSPAVDGTGTISGAQSIFESATIDMGSVIQLGIFQTGTITPPGTSLVFYTATSADGITWDAYVLATNGAVIPSTLHRYIKWKAIFTCPIDGGTYGDTTTPYVTDVSMNWFTGGGSNKFPTTVSYVFRYDTRLNELTQEFSDSLGGDSAIINDVVVQARPLVLSGTSLDTQWQGTTQTPPVPISVSAPLSVSAGALVYNIYVPAGMDTSLMVGANPAAAAITFAGGAVGSSWVFSRIHPTRPQLTITIAGGGTITDLRLIGKAFSNSSTGVQQQNSDAASIKANGDRQISISNPYIVNNTIALSIATKLVANYKNSISYIPEIMVDPTFAVQIGDRVTILDENTAIDADFIVVGVRHVLHAERDSASADTGLTLLAVT